MRAHSLQDGLPGTTTIPLMIVLICVSQPSFDVLRLGSLGVAAHAACIFILLVKEGDGTTLLCLPLTILEGHT